MSGETDFWSATIQAFAPLQLGTPEMTPKLLQRPPFRFIHDLVASVNARFAAYNSVIEPSFVDAANIDTKEKKIAYLEAIIQYVEKLLKLKIDVNPKKIVSGSEPEKTNVFLQYLAMAVGLAQQDPDRGVLSTAAPAGEKKGKEKKRKTSKHGNNEKEARTPGGTDAPPPPPLPEKVRSHSVTKAASVSAPFAPDRSNSLPNRGSLPRKKSSSAGGEVKKAANDAAIKEAEAFNKKLAGFSINLDRGANAADVKADNQNIVKMWQELQHPKVETTPSTMPEESLEMAVKRQLEAIKQIQGLMKENDKVIDKLEGLLV